MSEKFHSRGYYGSLTFNARAVYQKYYGFYDGNPVNLDPLPPEEEGRFIDAVGLSLRFQSRKRPSRPMIFNGRPQCCRILSSRRTSPTAQKNCWRLSIAMGFIMRNIYLTGAMELEQGVTPLPMAGGRNSDLAATFTIARLV